MNIIKSKKRLRNALAIMAAFLFTCLVQAQNEPTTTSAGTGILPSVTFPLGSYWQLSGRVGYDFPTYKPTDSAFSFIDHKGGIMGGLSLNKSWSHWGFEVDADYISNSVKSTFPIENFLLNGSPINKDSIKTQKKNITRMFFGAGPAYKYASPNNKITVDAAVMGGLGIVNGGEILTTGIDRYTNEPVILSYHSGFDNAKTFTVKTQVRMNYFFKPNWGVNLGAYYINHFKVDESRKNTILKDNGFATPTNGIYYKEVYKTEETTGGYFPGEDVPVYKINRDKYTRTWDTTTGVDEIEKLNVSSFGVFVGLTYRFNQAEKKPKPPKKEKIEDFTIHGKVLICNSTKPINGVTVTLKNTAKSGEEQTTVTNAAGEFVFTGVKRATYTLSGKKQNYFSDTKTIPAKDFVKSEDMNMNLEICMEKVDCGTAIRLNNILYDLDKYFIREDAKPDLDKVVQFMKDNPSVKVELASHTDSRASDAYNMTLSQNRAKSAVDYIISQGIDKSRIVAKGYGESKLLNKCSDGVPCTEDEHQLNRRTEFKVICAE